jgi:hypothetical protein
LWLRKNEVVVCKTPIEQNYKLSYENNYYLCRTSHFARHLRMRG